MKRLLKAMTLVLAMGALVAVGVGSYRHLNSRPATSFQLTPVTRGDLAETINATGTAEPEEVVDVGAQVAGQISSFGKDKNGRPIDYGSVVEAGTVLAKIDDSLYAADVAQAEATQGQAQANLQRAEADLGELKAKLDQAELDWNRAQKLGPSDALSQSSYDAYKAAYEAAQSYLAVGEATVAQNKAALVQAQAALQRAQKNLSYCTIVSPVDGVIIDRRVNTGQTVVSSLNAPSLFLIAKNLKRMQVWVSVNEADIGSIHPGQPVTFTLDARPGETFRGKVGKIRLNATMTQNVVTYTVEVITDNSSGKILPYLTANVNFEVARHTSVLTVPNAALRWTPNPQQIAAAPHEDSSGTTNPHGEPGGSHSAEHSASSTGASRHGVLWVVAGNGVRPIRVRTGLSDGVVTEVQGEALKEGLEVVTGERRQDSAPSAVGSANPFTPQISRGRQNSQGAR